MNEGYKLNPFSEKEDYLSIIVNQHISELAEGIYCKKVFGML